MPNQLTSTQLTVGLGTINSIVPLNSSLPYLIIGSKSVTITCTYNAADFTLSLPSIGNVSSAGHWARTYNIVGKLPASGKYLVGYSTSGWSNDTNNDGYVDTGSQKKTVTISSNLKSGGASFTGTRSPDNDGYPCGVALAAYRLS